MILMSRLTQRAACALSSSLRGLEVVPIKWRYLVPPGCRACRDTPAGTPQRACGAYASR
jgi:hypothetical protein